MSILHYIYRGGYLPGIAQEFGGGQIVETEDDGTTIIDVRSMYSAAPMAETPEGKTKPASKKAQTIEEGGEDK